MKEEIVVLGGSGFMVHQALAFPRTEMIVISEFSHTQPAELVCVWNNNTLTNESQEGSKDVHLQPWQVCHIEDKRYC